jgi:hypothetical protein
MLLARPAEARRSPAIHRRVTLRRRHLGCVGGSAGQAALWMNLATCSRSPQPREPPTNPGSTERRSRSIRRPAWQTRSAPTSGPCWSVRKSGFIVGRPARYRIAVAGPVTPQSRHRRPKATIATLAAGDPTQQRRGTHDDGHCRPASCRPPHPPPRTQQAADDERCVQQADGTRARPTATPVSPTHATGPCSRLRIGCSATEASRTSATQRTDHRANHRIGCPTQETLGSCRVA